MTIVSNILTFATTRSADSNLVHRTHDHTRALEKRRFFQEIGRNKTDISLGPRCLLFAPPWFHQLHAHHAHGFFCVKPSSTKRRSYVARGESQQLRWPSWLPSAPEGRNMNVLPRNSQLHFYVFHSCKKYILSIVESLQLFCKSENFQDASSQVLVAVEQVKFQAQNCLTLGS